MSQKILRTSLWFTGLSILASALNFLYYPVTARLLSLSEFGDVQIGVSFVMQAAALFTSLNTLALFFAAQKEDQSNVLARLERLIIGFSLVLALLTVLFSVPLSRVLQLNDASLLYILAVIFIINIPAATWLGSLQGSGQFTASGITAVISSGLKIVIGIIAISLGFGAEGALFGILAGTFIILPIAYLVQKEKLLHIRQTFSLPTPTDVRVFFGRPMLILLFAALFLLALASTLDVLAAKITLDPDSAGLYAQLSTAGKIAYFATVPIAIISFERLMKKKNKRKHIVAVFGTAVATITVLTILFEPLILGLFFGLKNSDYSSSDFLMVCVAFSAYSLTTLFAYSLISRRQILPVGFIALIIFLLPIVTLFNGEHTLSFIAQTYAGSQVVAMLVAAALQYTGTHE